MKVLICIPCLTSSYQLAASFTRIRSSFDQVILPPKSICNTFIWHLFQQSNPRFIMPQKRKMTSRFTEIGMPNNARQTCYHQINCYILNVSFISSTLLLVLTKYQAIVCTSEGKKQLGKRSKHGYTDRKTMNMIQGMDIKISTKTQDIIFTFDTCTCCNAFFFLFSFFVQRFQGRTSNIIYPRLNLMALTALFCISYLIIMSFSS